MILKLDEIYVADCFVLIEALEDQSADLVIADPPYNLHKADWDTFSSQEDFLDFTYKWIDAVIPKIKYTGSLFIFNTPFNSAYILQHLVKREMVFRNWITWDKRDGLGAAKTKFSNGQETILFFTKSNKNVFNYDAVRMPYESTERIKAAEKKGILKNGKRWFPNPLGKYCGEVWHDSSVRHTNKVNGKIVKQPHLTPKPMSIIERIILASTNPGDLVIDFFVGSGTTAIAAKKNGRHFICSDSNPDYIDLVRAVLYDQT